ncbi:MAG: DUF1822 family protein [Leptolyngbyaceae cyanobacterium bins.349]|nr:DUF1822 family protein [Leptolyngbyaceae cyanobacterium bins.349]
MSDYLIDDLHFSDDTFLDLEVLPAAAIALTDEQITRARELSQRVEDETQRWQAYLNALALMGFETWLDQRASDITLKTESARMMQSLSNGATTICNVVANGFKLCLIGTGGLVDSEVMIPTAALEQDDSISHFYVPVKVYEELGYILVTGFLSYVQLNQYRQSTALNIVSSDAYQLPLSLFESNIHHLLLQLSCLTPKAISLPNAEKSSPRPFAHLPWRQILLEPAVNVGTWIQQQWENVAQNLEWLLLPSTQLVTEMRSLTPSFKMRSRSIPEEFKSLLKDLEAHQVFVSEDAGSAYRELVLGDIPLRLYAVITQLNTPDASPEWSLLLILKTQDDAKLPAKIQLQVSDLNHDIVAQLTNQQADTGYLFARVIGCHHEQFLVTLSLPTGETLTLPPFAFSC